MWWDKGVPHRALQASQPLVGSSAAAAPIALCSCSLLRRDGYRGLDRFNPVPSRSYGSTGPCACRPGGRSAPAPRIRSAQWSAEPRAAQNTARHTKRISPANVSSGPATVSSNAGEQRPEGQPERPRWSGSPAGPADRSLPRHCVPMSPSPLRACLRVSNRGSLGQHCFPRCLEPLRAGQRDTGGKSPNRLPTAAKAAVQEERGVLGRLRRPARDEIESSCSSCRCAGSEHLWRSRIGAWRGEARVAPMARLIRCCLLRRPPERHV
jgi:hypothetical protein